MIEIKDKKLCSGCGACYTTCPTHAISMESDEEGFLYPKVDLDKCIHCNLCEQICPILNGRTKKEEYPADFPVVYAAYISNDEIRSKSSSGGIFYALAIEVLSKKGIVVGASFQEDFSVSHQIITKIDEIPLLQGSKYVQSNINGNEKLLFFKIKEYLLKDKLVLFSGTSCQIAGLKSYLRKDFVNLICIDLICKGIPSPLIWKSYLNYISPKHDISSINFKSKKYGWNLFSVQFLEKSKRIEHIGKFDPYMQLFFKGLTLRPVCYACPFKGRERLSDITLSDCWGYDKFALDLFDNYGLSSVFIHTSKGLKIWNSISANLKYKQVDFENAIQFNENFYQSAQIPTSRQEFYLDYYRMNFNKLLNKYAKVNFRDALDAYKMLLKYKLKGRKK